MIKASQCVDYREDEYIAFIVINRPEAMNALNAEVFAGLNAAIEHLETSQTIRCAVITGAGEKAFVAGADIKRFEGVGVDEGSTLALQGQRTFARIERLRQPVIAAVNGFALGGGLELALACDFIYASSNAKLGLPESSLGLMPGYGGTVRLAQRIGESRAREMAYTAAMVTAHEALAMGLVNRVTEPSELMTAVTERAQLIASRAPLAIAKIKQMILKACDLEQQAALELEAKFFGELFGTQDKIEGVRAFIEKRKAQFKGA